MTFAQIRQYVTGLLRASFTNKAQLDKIGEDSNGNLTYNGSAISGGGSSETITNNDIETAITQDTASIWASEQSEESQEEPGE